MKKFILSVLVASSLLFGCMTLIPVINTFDITPNTIIAGGAANLIWNVSGANSVSIAPGLGTMPASGMQSVNPTVTTAYTITASSSFGAVTKSAIIVVNPAPMTIRIDSNPAVLVSGGAALLRWDVTGANNVSIDQGIGNVPPNGTQLVSPTQTTTYTITANNTSGTMTKSATIAVNPPITADFSANPSTINIRQSSTLTWNVTGSDSISIDQGIGDVPASGSRIVTPNSTTSYTLTAKSSCCIVSKAAVVNVGTIYPYGYMPGMGYGLPYDNYYSFPFGGIYGPGGMSGGMYGTGGTRGYPFWSVGGNQPVTPFIEIFNITPNQVKAGQPALLHWNVIGATSVTISGIGNVSPNGSKVVVQSATTSYVLTASNAYSTDSKTVTVNVVP